MIAYPGRTFGQLYHRFVKGNALVHGSFVLDERTIALDRLTAPVLVFGGATDGIAPVNAVRAVLPLLSGSRDVRFEIVPGGHLGMLTGRAARGTTWRVLDEWITQWSSRPAGQAPYHPEGDREEGSRHEGTREEGARATKSEAPAKKTAAKTTPRSSLPPRRRQNPTPWRSAPTRTAATGRPAPAPWPRDPARSTRPELSGGSPMRIARAENRRGNCAVPGRPGEAGT